MIQYYQQTNLFVNPSSKINLADSKIKALCVLAFILDFHPNLSQQCQKGSPTHLTQQHII
ncbi:hypothetical protein THIOM_004624 [Candidatus Thiomargarita nelsonii]|uniref:Uncharacterized protein n=1 Tax=Candidatus Thiomargarita nelsonii TaxID=1003181 RepID=A0A176RVH6_9GAMM|nr:hypothetical protein THIOM_004624 [Candidatus Thiomargarita nelsonii]